MCAAWRRRGREAKGWRDVSADGVFARLARRQGARTRNAASSSTVRPAAGAAQGGGISLSAVTVRRAGQPVLRGITLELTERRIGLVGRNGSGKSTLARTIKGLLRPESGSVALYGIDPAERSPEALATAGFLFQNSDHQILCPTVLEEIAFGPAQAGSTQAQAEAAALALMEAHGIAGWAGRPVAALSEGQRRLVCLLAVLVMEPRLVILDEPFAGLDIPTRLKLGRFIARLPQQALVVSHDPETLAGFDRVIWLDEGAVRGDGPPGSVLPDFRAAMRAEGEAPLCSD
jgi:biotin transport system ATP-binding protein